jgi:hypothetical protein
LGRDGFVPESSHTHRFYAYICHRRETCSAVMRDAENLFSVAMLDDVMRVVLAEQNPAVAAMPIYWRLAFALDSDSRAVDALRATAERGGADAVGRAFLTAAGVSTAGVARSDVVQL